MTDDHAETTLVDRERIARAAQSVTLGSPERCMCDLPPAHLDDDAALAVADAVLDALPTPGQYVAGLADDETLVERVTDFRFGPGPFPAADRCNTREFISALAAALTERTDRD